MSSGVSRGDMSGSQSVKAGLSGAMGRELRPCLRARPKGQGYTRDCVCVCVLGESSNGQQESGFQNGTRGSSCESAGETSAGHGLVGREMFQNFQSGFALLLPDLKMSDRDGVRDEARDEVRLQEELRRCRGGATLQRTLSGQIDQEDPRSGNGLGFWSLEPGARCQVPDAGREAGGASGIIGQVRSGPGLRTTCACANVEASVEVEVTVTVTVTALRWFPSPGIAGCTGRVQLAVTRRMLEDGIGLSIWPQVVGGWSRWAPRSMAAREVTAGRASGWVDVGWILDVGCVDRCWLAGSWERGEELGGKLEQLEQLERAPAERATVSLEA